MDARRRAADLTDTLTLGAFKAAWSLVRTLPEPVAYRLFTFAADRAHAAGGAGVDQLRANLARIRPDLTGDRLEATVREGMRRYLRYYCAAFRLPAMSPSWCRTRSSCAATDPFAPSRRPVARSCASSDTWATGIWPERGADATSGTS